MDATGDGASSRGRMARRISMSTRNELVTALTERYARSSKSERSVILDEFVSVSGYHRKHAIRLLGARQKRAAPERRARRTKAEIFSGMAHDHSWERVATRIA